SKASTVRAVKRVEKKYQERIAAIEQEVQAKIETAKTQIINQELPKLVQSELEKAKTFNKNEAMRMKLAPGFNQLNNPDVRPGLEVSLSYLRRLSIVYPIARACINRRIRQITQLGWHVTTIDDLKDEKGHEAEIKLVSEWLKKPMGHKTRLREMLTIMVDDVLSVDAVCFEIQRKVNSEFMYLIPVDPTTVALRLTETGGTPEPPEPAYAQIINGIQNAEFTTDEMIYEAMNNRSYSPYGLAPLESLLLQVEAALRGMLYNLNYFKENNVPEGFIALPEEVAANPAQVEEWQSWFDSIFAGDMRMIHRLKILPGGAVYTPAKKPEDMSFEKFELWLLQQTCAVFDVPPQDIGITYQVNKATGETQTQLSNERGLYPLANFIKEILDDVVQGEMGFTSLQLKPQNLDPVDLKEEAEVARTEIEMGALSVDEYRTDHGREPIGLGHYVKTSSGPVLLKDILNPPAQPDVQPTKDTPPDPKKKMEEVDEYKMLGDLRRWRKCVYHDLEDGKPCRTWFPSTSIPDDVHKTIEAGLEGIATKSQAKLLFDQFLDPEVRAAMELLEVADQMKDAENVGNKTVTA
ncbi:phage portal protein, partial [Candidatus Woesebacteria bacterium]|nr:phage portal protein [Candidatus Woesebacteria bacterium]